MFQFRIPLPGEVKGETWIQNGLAESQSNYKLLSAFAERKDSTIRKLIEVLQETGLTLLASELEKRFLRGG